MDLDVISIKKNNSAINSKNLKDYSHESMNFDIDYQLLGGTKTFAGLVITFYFFPFFPFFLPLFLLVLSNFCQSYLEDM